MSRRGASQQLQRALGWTTPEHRDVGAVPKCSCGAYLEFPMDAIGRVDYDNPFCPKRDKCPDRVLVVPRDAHGR